MIRSPALSQITASSGLVTSGVPQRRLLLEVPPGTPLDALVPSGIAVAVDHLRRGDHGVGTRLPRYGDAVLGLGADHPPRGHARSPARFSRSAAEFGRSAVT